MDIWLPSFAGLRGSVRALGRAGKPEAAPAPSELTFSVTGEYPDRVLEVDGARHRAVGTLGGRGMYSIMALKLSGGDMRAAGQVKAAVVEKMLGAQRPDGAPLSAVPDMVYGAYSMCMGELSAVDTSVDREVLAYLVAHDIVGFGALSILLEDSQNIEEIEVNSPAANIVVYHSKYGRCGTNLRFNGEGQFRFSLNRLISATQKELSSSSPIIDAQLPDGSRVHAQLWPFSVSGAAASIRLNNGKGMDIARLMASKTVSEEVLAYLWMALETGSNIVITGAPASGKTSLLMALHALMPRYERIITIEEDVNELKFYGNVSNVVSLQGSSRMGSATLKDQVVNALHLRPERLVIGEMRGAEAKEAFAGANLGVPFMATIHSSENGQAVINRLMGKPMEVEPHAVSMLDISILMKRGEGSARFLDSIVEYRWLSRAEVEVADAKEEAHGNGLRFRQTVLAKNGILDRGALKDSKVIDAYRNAEMIRPEAALREFRKRARFLGGACQPPGGQADVYRYVSSYGEIR